MEYDVCKFRGIFDQMGYDEIQNALEDVSKLPKPCGDCLFRVECFRNFVTLKKTMEVTIQKGLRKIDLEGLNIYLPAFPKGEPSNGFVRWQIIPYAEICSMRDETESLLRQAFGDDLIVKDGNFFIKVKK